mmetsp:Transcript_120984/g.210455  ORF Transcript_120984/g.210455 Transcript_120984/m.210455 type:complete len:89 (-) Transcript_120984:861-1127(-)
MADNPMETFMVSPLFLLQRFLNLGLKLLLYKLMQLGLLPGPTCSCDQHRLVDLEKGNQMKMIIFSQVVLWTPFKSDFVTLSLFLDGAT